MVTLPSSPGRAWVRAFWLTVSVCGGVSVGGLAALVGSPRWAIGGVALTGLALLVGRVCPGAMSATYALWNALALSYARVARLGLKVVCFYVLFAAVGRTGSALALARPTPAESLWIPRATLAPSTYGYQYDAQAQGEPKGGGWTRDYIAWALDSGNAWAIILLPFVAMLSALEDEDQWTFPTSVYTLF